MPPQETPISWWRTSPMCCVRCTLSATSRKEVARHLQTAQPRGNWRHGQYLLAIVAVLAGQRVAQVAGVWRVHETTVAAWGGVCGCSGGPGAPRQKPTGRPPQLPPTQTAALAPRMDAGPVTAGFRGAGWRSPRLPQ
jgi:hypothetical protein